MNWIASVALAAFLLALGLYLAWTAILLLLYYVLNP